jgi:Icc-related predicted phosphoesterase
MKIAHISDPHNDNSYLIPDCDLFINSGDLTNFGSKKETDNALNHINSQKDNFKSCIIIAGNHDRHFVKNTNFYDFKIVNKAQKIDYNGVKIACYNSVEPLPLHLTSPQKRLNLLNSGFENGRWCFEKDYIERRQELAELGESDIIISHCPPTGLNNGYYDKQGCCAELRDYILKYQPKYCFCGHVHQLNGVYKIGETTVVVSCNTMRVFEI